MAIILLLLPFLCFISLVRLLCHLALLLLILMLLLLSIHQSFIFIGISVCQPFYFCLVLNVNIFRAFPIYFFETVFFCGCYYCYLFHSCRFVIYYVPLLVSILVKYNLLLFDCGFVPFFHHVYTFISLITQTVRETPTMRITHTYRNSI